ncbi:hypothetical protein [Bradyrhizobium roseum]|uniref:hypothetical protein n=1 Tax=Bradyrhizobium roseum TaxID=3056648 RepID=UPI00263494CF|nr:hypothetical protein [Bradyrhizobium roseus]WKA31615.1 hypothetical protein QUH67_16275 [Bradyrhizobium roseus]
MWSFVLIVPGLVVAYLMFVRPVLRAVPAFRSFYAEADSVWQKVWAVCGKSLTVAWSYLVLAASTVLSQIDLLAATLGDPNFKEQVTGVIGTDPKVLGYFAMVVSTVTIAARLRSIGKA